MKKLLLFIIAAGLLSCSGSEKIQMNSGQDLIRINQVGYYPDAPKIAVIAADTEGDFEIINTSDSGVVFSGQLEGPFTSSFSDKQTYQADFSAFTQPGNYVLQVDEIGYSYPFDIKAEVYLPLAKAALKSFYYQRASTELPQQFAGKWFRRAGHPDDEVKVHPSAATEYRPEGTTINSSLGWYDAGDYGKYIVNSGISTATLMALYQDFLAYSNTLSLNIPETTNQVPDLLDEILWNIRWMLTMQDPNDGGVYHKMTTANFEGMVMPDQATSTRFVIQKSTAASLDFAAVMAQASRIYQVFEQQYPGLADSCLTSAENAWQWARENPEQIYDQNAMNAQYDPDVNTGAYGDENLEDEFNWAASELYITTLDDQFYNQINFIPWENFQIPGWPQVQLLGYYSLIREKERLPADVQTEINQLEQKMISFANQMIQEVEYQAYKTIMEKDMANFVWGSNAVASNQGIALIQAYQISKDQKYLNYALYQLDYLLGKNATGYSYVTGFGEKTPMFIHHRPSEADQIEDPVPGFLVGGPNPGQQDREDYDSDIPDESYVDVVGSYASNEIAINWNAPFVYLTAALEALQYQAGYANK
ncbi:MAG: glycoside hydrolase family 9 protein [Candidatus Cyclobacteriaceae bacterium M3_2C_046]